MAKKRAEEEEKAKPKFLSKEERAALALKRRAEQVGQLVTIEKVRQQQSRWTSGYNLQQSR